MEQEKNKMDLKRWCDIWFWKELRDEKTTCTPPPEKTNGNEAGPPRQDTDDLQQLFGMSPVSRGSNNTADMRKFLNAL